VTDKNRQTFPQGTNPFDYLGFIVNEDGKKLTYQEHDGTSWKVYQDLPPKMTNFDRQHWNKGFKLSNWVPCYDWTSVDGYNKFSS